METGSSTLLDEKTQTRTRLSPRWQIIGINDDITSMDYVMMLLMDVFNQEAEAAYELMMDVHETGSATFFVGSREVCEHKVDLVKDMNKKYEQSLWVIMEPMED